MATPSSQEPPFPVDAPVCPRCGSENLGKGYILFDKPNFRPAPFAPKQFTPGRARRALRVWHHTLDIEAEVCRDCGYLMLSVDPDTLQEVEKKFPAAD